MEIRLVDDVQEYLDALSRALRMHKIAQAADLREVRERMDESIELVLTDIRLSEDNAANRDGIQLLQ